MFRALSSILAAVLLLAACDLTSHKRHIPSGQEAPILDVFVLAGTKPVPVAIPVVQITWQHQDSVWIALNTGGADDTTFFAFGPGQYTTAIQCTDSVRIEAFAVAASLSTNFGMAIDSSHTVYCK